MIKPEIIDITINNEKEYQSAEGAYRRASQWMLLARPVECHSHQPKSGYGLWTTTTESGQFNDIHARTLTVLNRLGQIEDIKEVAEGLFIEWKASRWIIRAWNAGDVEIRVEGEQSCQ